MKPTLNPAALIGMKAAQIAKEGMQNQLDHSQNAAARDQQDIEAFGQVALSAPAAALEASADARIAEANAAERVAKEKTKRVRTIAGFAAGTVFAAGGALVGAAYFAKETLNDLFDNAAPKPSFAAQADLALQSVEISGKLPLLLSTAEGTASIKRESKLPLLPFNAPGVGTETTVSKLIDINTVVNGAYKLRAAAVTPPSVEGEPAPAPVWHIQAVVNPEDITAEIVNPRDASDEGSQSDNDPITGLTSIIDDKDNEKMITELENFTQNTLLAKCSEVITPAIVPAIRSKVYDEITRAINLTEAIDPKSNDVLEALLEQPIEAVFEQPLVTTDPKTGVTNEIIFTVAPESISINAPAAPTENDLAEALNVSTKRLSLNAPDACNLTPEASAELNAIINSPAPTRTPADAAPKTLVVVPRTEQGN